MKEKIGGVAGEIWQVLGTRGETALTQLPRMVKYKSEVTYQGLGWLAREGKINYTTKAGKTFITLTDTEREIFREVSLKKKS